MALEVLLVVSIVTGFSFGVPKAQILGTGCMMLGERVGRDGRWATDDHIEAVGRMKPVEDISQLRACSAWPTGSRTTARRSTCSP